MALCGFAVESVRCFFKCENSTYFALKTPKNVLKHPKNGLKQPKNAFKNDRNLAIFDPQKLPKNGQKWPFFETKSPEIFSKKAKNKIQKAHIRLYLIKLTRI